jgi:AAHS family 4-hydroxybenzoate transporter-like MFS transporter
MMFSGFPLGAAFGGFLAAWMIPLFGWRSVTALGIAAPRPSPVRKRRITSCVRSPVNAETRQVPLGAAFGGFLAAWMIPLFGWRSVLVFGGVVPLVLHQE